MRERRWFATCNLSVYGITPAYAGKTLALSRCLAGSRDHPRVCGKDSAAYNQRMYSMGSPPRMRERRKEIKTNTTFFRITPAYAGKTLKIPIKMAISITETVKFHLLFKFNLSQNMVQQYFIFMK